MGDDRVPRDKGDPSELVASSLKNEEEKGLDCSLDHREINIHKHKEDMNNG